MLLALALLGQVLLSPQQAYTAPTAWGDLELATPAGRYAMWFGFNCDAIDVGQNVEMWPLDAPGGQAVLAPLDTAGRVETHTTTPEGVANQLCSVALIFVDPTPCSTNAQGACDVALEPFVNGLGQEATQP